MSSSSVLKRFALAMIMLLAMLSGAITVVAQDATPGASPVAGDELAAVESPDFGPAFPEDLLEGDDYTCAILVVPQNHDEPDGPQLELLTIVLPSHSETPAAEPIVFLAGGPGQAGSAQLVQFSNKVPERFTSFSPFFDTHDVVLIDQRGTGFSEPSLACPADLAMTATPEATPQADTEEPGSQPNAVELYGECDEVLTEAGVDLTSFNTVQNAADIDALRLALGVERVNLVGTSYGSQLAQVVIRDFPDSVNSVVMNSPVPLQANLLAGQLFGFQTALDATFEGCMADPQCLLSFPVLEDQLAQVVATLNALPMVVTVEDPMSGEPTEIPVDGDFFMFVLYQIHFTGTFVPVVPSLIASIAAGDDQVLVEVLPLVLPAGGLASGFYYSVICQDEVAFTSEEEIRAVAEDNGVSQLVLENGSGPTTSDIFEICAAWDLPASPAAENEAIGSELPTLILTGVFDPITPTIYGEIMLPTLTNATLVESGIAGHDPLSTSGECGVAVVHSFLIDPGAEVDSTCLIMAQPDFSPDPSTGEGTPEATPAS